MASFNDKQRREFALEAVRTTDAAVAAKAGVKLATVARWRNKFAPDDSPAAGAGSRSAEAADAAAKAGVSGKLADTWPNESDAGENLARTPEQIAESINSSIAIVLARQPNTPPEILEGIFLKGLIRVTLALADNPNTPGHILRQIYEYGESHAKIAANPSTPADILEELAENPDAKILTALGGNPSLPVPLMRKMVDDTLREQRTWDILDAITGNRSVPHELFAEWAESGEDVWFLAAGTEVPEDILLTIVQKTKPGDSWVHREFLRYPHTPASVLDKVARMTTDEFIVALAAEHPNTAADTLEYIAFRQ